MVTRRQFESERWKDWLNTILNPPSNGHSCFLGRGGYVKGADLKDTCKLNLNAQSLHTCFPVVLH